MRRPWLDVSLHYWLCPRPGAAKYEPADPKVATGGEKREMTIVLTEPTVLLLFGTVLLLIAGAVRKLTV